MRAPFLSSAFPPYCIGTGCLTSELGVVTIAEWAVPRMLAAA
jgi:hypothetical protein